MKIKIICVGKIKEKYFADGIKEYEKRLSRFCKFEICEVADEKIPDNASEKEALAVLDSEGAKIEKHIGKGDYIIALCVEGKNISSADLAKNRSVWLEPPPFGYAQINAQYSPLPSAPTFGIH